MTPSAKMFVFTFEKEYFVGRYNKKDFSFFFSFICMDNHYSYVSLKVAKGCQFRDHPSLIRPSIARSARNPRIGPYTRPLGLTASAKLRVNLRKS